MSGEVVDGGCVQCDGKGWWWCDIDDDEEIRQRCSACRGTAEPEPAPIVPMDRWV